MSKNTYSSQFRKVDVDKFAEDQFNEDVSDVQVAGPNKDEVKNLLNVGKNIDALKTCLSQAPVSANTKYQDEKTAAAELISSVLVTFKSSEVEKAVNALDNDSLDILMKYIYKLMETQPDKSGTFLLWHQWTLKKAGLGSIVRAMTDRKRV